MTPIIYLLVGLACFIVGGVAAFFARQALASRKLRLAEEESRRLIESARDEQKAILLEAKEAAFNIKAEA